MVRVARRSSFLPRKDGWLIIYAPFLVWEVTSKFSDIPVILIPTKRPPVIDDSAFTFYSRWTLLHSEQPASRTTYNYVMDLHSAGSTQSTCLLTSVRAGDQLVATFPISQNDVEAHSFSITSQFLVKSPYTITLGALHFETFKLRQGSIWTNYP